MNESKEAPEEKETVGRDDIMALENLLQLAREAKSPNKALEALEEKL